MRSTEVLRAELAAAMVARDPGALEDAVYAAFEADLPSELSDLLADVLLLPWHFRHEDVATALHRMKDPRAVNALAQAAVSRHSYLAYDDLNGLAHKCIAALAGIGNADARARLEELATTSEPACARMARARLAALANAADPSSRT